MNPDLDRALEHAGSSRRLLVACDFDGTLSPIVADPADAAPNAAALVPLYALAGLPRTSVLILSGRAREDLERRLGPHPPEVELVGSHGAEHAASAGEIGHPDVESFRELLEPVVTLFPGAAIETKPFSAAFHYRRVPEPDQARARQTAVERAGHRAAETREGKKVIEFMAVPADKGSALNRFRLSCEATTVVFLGDDVTDEAAFRALARGDVGVKVGPERTAAAHRVADPDEVTSVLARLLYHRSRLLGE